MGSSPLTRGKPPNKVCAGVIKGLIPAHAGKTLPRVHCDRQPQAHPRSRGENTPRGTLARSSAGSSPLTRGKLRRLCGLKSSVGLIPAHAGKTFLLNLSVCLGWAHPRSRGENKLSQHNLGLPNGSSPLTRGKRRGSAGGRHPLGLIPAHAGKTLSVCPCRQGAGAHPRSRGENMLRP